VELSAGWDGSLDLLDSAVAANDTPLGESENLTPLGESANLTPPFGFVSLVESSVNRTPLRFALLDADF